MRVTDDGVHSLNISTDFKESDIHHSKTIVRLGRILSIGKGAGRLLTRAGVLRSTGCSVCSAVPEDVLRLVRGCFYRIVIFGEGISHPEAAELAVCTRAANSRSQLILLAGATPAPKFVEALFDIVITNPEDDAFLAESLQHLLKAA